MRIGAFEVEDSLRELREPHVISTLRPWVDAGSVGKLVLAQLQDGLGAREGGFLVRPGQFFDFTRYRPIVRYNGEERVFAIPNSTISYSRRDDGPDLVLIDMLEPHAAAEEYTESIMQLLASLGAKRYWRVGAWYGAVPHTRPLRVSKSVAGTQVDPRTGRPIQQTRRYEGPTSMMSLMNDDLDKLGIENMAFMLQLPHYAQLEEDYSGVAAILEALSEVYGLSKELGESILIDRSRGERQYNQLDSVMASDANLKGMVEQLESVYDAEMAASSPRDDTPALSPEIEKFLGEINERMDSDDSQEGRS